PPPPPPPPPPPDGCFSQPVVGAAMTGIAILLLVASAFVHAGWNLLGKHRNPTSAFFLLAALFGTLLLTPVILWNWTLLAAFGSAG
ncbi:MAG: hypothetical protein KJ919_16355, partial [Verrucomicrobia bacterium]|nr:hypothetical protein [Verrucomicrobiota bacterium]